MNEYIIDGRNIEDIKTLCSEFASAVDAPENYFGKDFQSFDDCLFGGFGLDSPCTIIWKHSKESRRVMDSQMLIEDCEDTLANCPDIHKEGHEEGKEYTLSILEKARLGELTYFDEIVDAISSITERSNFKHKVELILE